MLSGLRIAGVLAGGHGRAQGDVGAVIDVLIRLGEMAIDLQDRISEVDVNPLFVLAAGQGVLGGDELVVLK